MARVIATTLAALALWLAYCLSGVAWRLLRIARHRPETAADAVRFGLLGAAKVAPHGLLYPAAMIESATVVAVGARDPSRAHRLASRWGITRSGDYASVLTDPAVEAVFIMSKPGPWPDRAAHAADRPRLAAPKCRPGHPLALLKPCSALFCTTSSAGLAFRRRCTQTYE